MAAVAMEPFPALKVLDALRATRDLDVNLKGLQDLLKELGTSRAAPSLLSLLYLSPDLKELPAIWDAQLTVKDPRIYTALLRVYAELLLLQGKPPARVLPPPLRKLQQGFTKHVLSHRMKAVYFNLTSGQRPRINATLHLLAAVAARGAALTRDLVTAFDFKLSSLPTLAAPPREKNGPLRRGLFWKRWAHTSLTQRPTRALFVEFAVSILSNCDADLLGLILANRVLMGGLMNHLGDDPPPVVYEVLRLFHERVLGPTSRLLPAQRAQAFGDTALQQLAALSALDRKAALADGAAARDVKQVQDLAYQILDGLCSDPSQGLVGNDEEDVVLLDGGSETQAGGQRGRLSAGSRRVLRLILKLHALEVPSYCRLVLKVTAAQPALAVELLKSIPYDLEPQPTARWFACVRVVQALLQVAGTQKDGMHEVTADWSNNPPQTLDSETTPFLTTVHLPLCLTKALLSRGIQHANQAVQLHTLRTFSTVLTHLEPILAYVESCAAALGKTSPSNDPARSWVQVYRELRALIRSRLPDLQTLLSLTSTTASLASAETAAAKTGANNSKGGGEIADGGGQAATGGEAEARAHELTGSAPESEHGRVEQQTLAQVVLEVVGRYSRWMPEGAADSHFDPNKLLAQDVLAYSPAVQVSLLGVLRSHALSKSHRNQGVDLSSVTTGPFLQLLILLTASPSPRARQLAKELLAHRLLSLGAFTFNPQEVQVWLTQLPTLPVQQHATAHTALAPRSADKSSTFVGKCTTTLQDQLGESERERETQEDGNACNGVDTSIKKKKKTSKRERVAMGAEGEEQDEDVHADKEKKKKKSKRERVTMGAEGEAQEEDGPGQKKKKRRVKEDDDGAVLLQKGQVLSQAASSAPAPWFESTLNFLSEAVVLMARRPVELYTQMEKMLTATTGNAEVHQKPSLLAIAALRQTLKVLKSEKMGSGDKATITGYVAGVLGTLMRQGEQTEGICLLVYGLLNTEFPPEGPGARLELVKEAQPLRALWEHGQRLCSGQNQPTSSHPASREEIRSKKGKQRAKRDKEQSTAQHSMPTGNTSNDVLNGGGSPVDGLWSLDIWIRAEDVRRVGGKGAGTAKDELQQAVAEAREQQSKGSPLSSPLLANLQSSLPCVSTEECASALCLLLQDDGPRPHHNSDAGLVGVATFAMLAQQLSLAQIASTLIPATPTSGLKKKKKMLSHSSTHQMDATAEDEQRGVQDSEGGQEENAQHKKKKKKKKNMLSDSNTHQTDAAAEDKQRGLEEEEDKEDLLHKKKKKSRKRDGLGEEDHPIHVMTHASQKRATDTTPPESHADCTEHQHQPDWPWTVLTTSLGAYAAHHQHQQTAHQASPTGLEHKSVKPTVPRSVSQLHARLQRSAQSTPVDEHSSFALSLLGCLPNTAASEIVDTIFDMLETLSFGSQRPADVHAGVSAMQKRGQFGVNPSRDTERIVSRVVSQADGTRLGSAATEAGAKAVNPTWGDVSTSPSADWHHRMDTVGTILASRVLRRSFLAAGGVDPGLDAESARSDESAPPGCESAQCATDLRTMQYVLRVHNTFCGGVARHTAAGVGRCSGDADSAVRESGRRERLDGGARWSKSDLEQACRWFVHAAAEKLQVVVGKAAAGVVAHRARVLSVGLELLPVDKLQEVVKKVLLHLQVPQENLEAQHALLLPLARSILTNAKVYSSLPTMDLQTLLLRASDLILAPTPQPTPSQTHLEAALLTFLQQLHSTQSAIPASGPMPTDPSTPGPNHRHAANTHTGSRRLEGAPAAPVSAHLPTRLVRHCLREPTWSRSHLAAHLVGAGGRHLALFEEEYEDLLADATSFMESLHGPSRARRCAVALFLPVVEAYLTYISNLSPTPRPFAQHEQTPSPSLHKPTTAEQWDNPAALSLITTSCMEPLTAYAARKRKKILKGKQAADGTAGVGTTSGKLVDGNGTVSKEKSSSSHEHRSHEDTYPEEVLLCLHEYATSVLLLGVKLSVRVDPNPNTAGSTGRKVPISHDFNPSTAGSTAVELTASRPAKQRKAGSTGKDCGAPGMIDGVHKGIAHGGDREAAEKLLDKLLPVNGVFSLEESESLPLAGADEQLQLGAQLIELVLTATSGPTDEAAVQLLARFTHCCCMTLAAVIKSSSSGPPASFLTRLESLLYRVLQQQALRGIVELYSRLIPSTAMDLVLEGLGALAEAVPLYRFDNPSAVYCLASLLGALLPDAAPTPPDAAAEHDSEHAERTRDKEGANSAGVRGSQGNGLGGSSESDSESDSDLESGEEASKEESMDELKNGKAASRKRKDKEKKKDKNEEEEVEHEEEEEEEEEQKEKKKKTKKVEALLEGLRGDSENANENENESKSADMKEKEDVSDGSESNTSSEIEDKDGSESDSESEPSQSEQSEQSLLTDKPHADSAFRGTLHGATHPGPSQSGPAHTAQGPTPHPRCPQEVDNTILQPVHPPVHHPGMLRLAGLTLQGFLGNPKFQACMGGGQGGVSAAQLPGGVARYQGVALESVFAVVDGCVAADMEAAARTVKNLVEGAADGDEVVLPPLKALLVSLLLTVLDLLHHFSGEEQGTCGLAVQALDDAVLLELLQLLMVTYGATLSEKDRTLLSLMLRLDQIIRAKAATGASKPMSPLAGPLSAAAFTWGSTAQRLFSRCSLRQLWAEYSQMRSEMGDEATAMEVEGEGERGLTSREVLELHRGTIKEGGGVELVRVALTCVMLPSWCSWEPLAGPTPPNHLGFFTTTTTAAYDPAYAIRHAHAVMRHDLSTAARFVECGLLSLTVRCLAAVDDGIRSLAYEVLALFSQALSLQDFRARAQIHTLLSSLKNSITTPLQRIPTPAAVFAADACLLLLHPESALYGTVNQHLLKYEALALDEVALCGRLIHAGTPGTWKLEQMWALRYLWAACRTEEDAYILRRRFFPQALLALHESPYIPPAATHLAFHAVCQFLQVPVMAGHLVKESGLATWLASVALHGAPGAANYSGGSKPTTTITKTREAIMATATLSLGSLIQQLHVNLPDSNSWPSAHIVQCVTAVMQLTHGMLTGGTAQAYKESIGQTNPLGKMSLEHMNEHQLLSLVATLLAQRYDSVTALSLVPPALIQSASPTADTHTNPPHALSSFSSPMKPGPSELRNTGQGQVSSGCLRAAKGGDWVGQRDMTSGGVMPPGWRQAGESWGKTVIEMNRWLLRLLVGGLARQ